MREALVKCIDKISGRLLVKFKFYNEKSRLAYGLSLNPNASQRYMLERSASRAIGKLEMR